MKLFTILFFFVLFLVCDSFAKITLPRSVGKVMLGMTSERFFELTHKRPGECLGDCQQDEKYAILRKDDLNKIGIRDIDSVEVAFWKGKIYFLMYGYKQSRKFNNSYYESKYGKFLVTPQGTPGLVTAKWATKDTLMMVTFSEPEKEIVSFAIKDLSRNTDGAGW